MSHLLKDQISLLQLECLADLLIKHNAKFDKQVFINLVVTDSWERLGLKQRIKKVSASLNQCLSGDFEAQLTSLLLVHHQFNGLFHYIFSEFVECYGLEFFEASMSALSQFTQTSSSEFAVRPFIIKYPEKMASQLESWAQSDNEHLRRLASEGIRPKLPWAKHLPEIAQNPQRVKPIIDLLNNDSSRYVQKSVANLMNDLSKTQPQWVLCEIDKWDLMQSNRFWIARHALRTLLKKGDVEALSILGYPKPSHIKLQNFSLNEKVQLGNKIPFSFTLQSQQQLGLVRLEYAISFLRKKNTAYRKVFKISESSIQAKQKSWNSHHDFKKINTRNYYPGIHVLEVMVNGQVLKTSEFTLID